MKIAMYDGKPTLVTAKGDQLWGTAITSYTSVDDILADWNNFQATFLLNLSDQDVLNSDSAELLDPSKLEAPVSHPRQIPAVGFNYADHMKEMDIKLPEKPNVFNKFVSSLAGPNNSIRLSGDTVDWESELVIVIGNGGRNISREDAEDAIAGYMIGQDLSDRTIQSIDGPSTQFTLGKSFKNFTPVGPYISTVAESGDIESKHVVTKVNGDVMQDATIDKMIFDVPTLISYISSIIELYPGDIILTGTPSGTGVGREPKVFLKSGDLVESSIDGLGTIVTKVD
ncbi:fumarylacetoacetate hydrolase family protein [Lentilactobacillus sp. Marseille-Q4993]|uniref:fumarylacetoacetate hydrolase family protein n=1 Tax=Lentilactobacillus sp. Marseille-Q4993 TaxID=3039492 RepID=UPI0024BCF9B4|nr:fumarylacetoacetate hydrolase family protein [Lentilactobacillus sp. Marseille-Q4993]